MTVLIGSRYATGTLNVATVDGINSQFVSRGVSPLPVPRGYNSYICSAEERLDLISSKFYGRSDYWWVIADANPGLVFTDPLKAGTMLRIPNAADVY